MASNTPEVEEVTRELENGAHINGKDKDTAEEEAPVRTELNIPQPDEQTVRRILGVIYGQCVGDALGLLTEFLSKAECKTYYKTVAKKMEFEHKMIVNDMHRTRWKIGDWTDDSDQMLLILLGIIENNGKVDHLDFARRMKKWLLEGFRELGDYAGMGVGRTTAAVLTNPKYTDDPHAAAYLVWDHNKRVMAPNGSVMRTSILGVHQYNDLEAVKQNALTICKATHADPRCQSAVVAVSTAIAMMLQGQEKHKDKKGNYKVDVIIQDAYDIAVECLELEEHKKELSKHMRCKNIKELLLDEAGKIGYTYKSMGSAFWALKQNDFRKAIQKVVMQGGDADSNACVAGAMLGCKLSNDSIPSSWRDQLCHKEWLDNHLQKYFKMMGWTVNL